MRLSIRADGTVKSADAAPESTLVDASVTSCVSRTLLPLQFPTSSAATAVSYPFVFTSGG